ncbi:hypothetical protein [Dyadobacter sp. OTU695]|uniref:hypothetical protein n=1 Tax=Dyadobacter sp. OTU695 TaxID=3043860 RepID=UPI00313C4C93
MKLALSAIMPSPVKLPDCTIWVASDTGVFLMAGLFEIVGLAFDGAIHPIWKTSDEEIAYAMKGYYDTRLTEKLYDDVALDGIDGFCLLEINEYHKIDKPNGSNALMNVAKNYGLFGQQLPVRAHDTILSFASKEIRIIAPKSTGTDVLHSVKTKGKLPVATTLHPQQNLIMYGTNDGQLYGQYFEENSFTKTVKIGKVPNTCSQLAFNEQGDRFYVCGTGFLHIFNYHNDTFSLRASLSTAARSFVLVETYLILNKGMHGVEVWHIENEPRRVTSLEIPFAIDKMEYLWSVRTLLLTSATTQQVALVRCDLK